MRIFVPRFGHLTTPGEGVSLRVAWKAEGSAACPGRHLRLDSHPYGYRKLMRRCTLHDTSVRDRA